MGRNHQTTHMTYYRVLKIRRWPPNVPPSKKIKRKPTTFDVFIPFFFKKKKANLINLIKANAVHIWEKKACNVKCIAKKGGRIGGENMEDAKGNMREIQVQSSLWCRDSPMHWRKWKNSVVSKSSQTPIIQNTKTNGHGSVGGTRGLWFWWPFFCAPLRWCRWRGGYGEWSESRETMLGIATPTWYPIGIPWTLSFIFALTATSVITLREWIYAFRVLIFLSRWWWWVWEEG